MSIVFITLILGTTVLLSWPVAKGMTWAMHPADNMGGFRQRIDSLVSKGLRAGSH